MSTRVQINPINVVVVVVVVVIVVVARAFSQSDRLLLLDTECMVEFSPLHFVFEAYSKYI